MVPVVPDMYKALSIHKIRQNTNADILQDTLLMNITTKQSLSAV